MLPLTPIAFDVRASNRVQLIGQSPALRAMDAEIEAAARCHAKVLITGETGAGKEVVARLIHQRSTRVKAPIVTVNCAGVPDSLLESELFGHVRGSFTDAYRDKPGLLESAPNGTVFLDEVGEMTTRMQALLLRFLETGEIQRVGADRVQARVDVRVITATNRNLEAEVAAGRFREDLYFRLNVIRVCVPALRDRLEDVPLLVQHFLQIFTREHGRGPFQLAPAAMDALMAHRWPGNIRELKNVVERVVLKASGPTIDVTDLTTDVLPPRTASTPADERLADRTQPQVATTLMARMIEEGESFWSAIYPAFMRRDLTRADLRTLIALGLRETRGNYRTLIELFHMAPGDYKRFLGFLRKHDCHLPFQSFRALPESASTSPSGHDAPARAFLGAALAEEAAAAADTCRTVA
jgi:transcriptional regulator with GAF, ATPase, and Fis domain